MKRSRGHRFVLRVDVKSGDGIDAGNLCPVSQPRVYEVFCSLDCGASFSTREVFGCPDPSWRVIHSMKLKEHEIHGDLNLEVIRKGSKADPGTSGGSLVVGMTQIPIPQSPNAMVAGRFGLLRPVGLDFVPDGHITVALKLEKI